MNYNKKTVKDIDVAGKKVLLRCDFNVPQDKATGAITDDKRIVAALPTIQYLLEQNAAVIACSHLGKPKEGPDPKFSLAPVAKRLSELLGREVIMAADVVGPDATAKAAVLKPGQILLLENTRFEKGETKVLCACDLLNEGWDCPATEVLFMPRPTMSKVLYTQQLGRGMRLSPGKESLMVFDFVDNASQYNMPCSMHRLFRLKEYKPGAFANVR